MTIAKVLIVDDEEGFVGTMTKRLTKRDFNVVSAYRGLQALEQLEENDNIDIVILDVKMPGMDGLETLKEIKKKYPLVEVIMLTGHATVESAIEGMKQGAFDYLMKPCDLAQLIDKTKEAVAKKHKHEEKIVEARIKEITSRRA